MSPKKMIWNEEDKSVRGSFINFMVTMIYIALIILGCIFDSVAENVEKMGTFLIGFFAVSFSVWAGKQVIENIQNISTAADAVSGTLLKLGIKIPAAKKESEEDHAG